MSQPEAQAPDTPDDDAPREDRPFHERLRDVVNSLARRLDPNLDAYSGGFGTGDTAELRRLDAEKGVASTCAPFWRIVVQNLEPSGLVDQHDGDAKLVPWIAILRSLAQMAGLHRPGRALGQALAAANVSEMRLERLLRARDKELYDQLRVTLHALASHGETVDGVEIARFVLSDTWGEVERERARRQVARAYYRTESKSDTETENENETAA